jgi:hypothetical protein
MQDVPGVAVISHEKAAVPGFIGYQRQEGFHVFSMSLRVSSRA